MHPERPGDRTKTKTTTSAQDQPGSLAGDRMSNRHIQNGTQTKPNQDSFMTDQTSSVFLHAIRSLPTLLLTVIYSDYRDQL